MPTYLRQDQATISVPSLAVNLPYVKSWATLEGGDIESEDVKTRPGGMVGQVNLGGPSTRTDCTVQRPYTKEIHPYIVQLDNVAGRSAMKVTYSILGPTAAVIGPTVTLTGILKNVMRPNFDSNASGVAMLGLVMGCDVAAHIS
jgi:hypothetical protein